MCLFDVFDEAKEQAEDNTQITQVLLYYSDTDAAEFKSLCKRGMIASGENLKEANVSDFLLTILKKLYADPQSKEMPY